MGRKRLLEAASALFVVLRGLPFSPDGHHLSSYCLHGRLRSQVTLVPFASSDMIRISVIFRVKVLLDKAHGNSEACLVSAQGLQFKQPL